MNNSHLNSEQRIAAEHFNGPMLVVAGPGSGKTHLLIERLNNLIGKGIEPEHILVITFSKKAALEMENRFKRKYKCCNGNISFGTFHAVFFNILKYYNLYSTEGILDNKTKFKFIERAGISLGFSNASARNWQIDMLEKISYFKNIGNSLFEDSYYFMDENEKEIFLKVYGAYDNICQNEKKLDFDDMVYKCRSFFEENKKALEFWQNRYKYILIDEFQDINTMQYDVIKLLGGEDKNIFAVGDDDQSIYGFRGAMPGIMSTFMEDFAPCEKVILKMNYRSCFQIVEAATSLIQHNSQRIQRPRQNTLKNRAPGAVIRRTFATAEDEATFVLNELGKYELSDVAIIYRSDHCGTLIEEKVREAGIRYDKRVQNIEFLDLEIPQILISYLKCSIDTAELSDYLRIINIPDRNLSREALINDNRTNLNNMAEYYLKMGAEANAQRIKSINKLTDDLRIIKGMPLNAAIIYILKGIGVGDILKKNYKKDSRFPVTYDELISEFRLRCEGYSSIEGFINDIAIRRDTRDNYSNKQNDHAKSKKAVTFITAHASKGLEYPVVFVIGLQEGLFPHRKNLEGPGLEEERRLCYVAMTRAKERLYLCAIGSEYGKIPSRFLSESQCTISNQSFIASNSSLSRNSSKASATASYSSSSSI